MIGLREISHDQHEDSGTDDAMYIVKVLLLSRFVWAIRLQRGQYAALGCSLTNVRSLVSERGYGQNYEIKR